VSALLNNILPVFVLVALGQVLLRARLADERFFAISDRLIYFFFFPALLFWKVGAAGPKLVLPGRLILATLAAIFILWLASLAYIRLARVPHFQAGTFSQVSFRFNTYVGMAVVMSAFGEEGVARFGIIISLAIPFINVLAVSTLVWHAQAQYSGIQKLRMVLRAMLVNPLILACLAAIAFARSGLVLPVFLERSLALGASVSLPMALLSIGASLSLAKLKGRLGLALVSCLLKLLLLPLVGYSLLRLLDVGGLSLSVAMLYFALPTATSAYILSGQLNSDTDLAGAAIVLSTILSMVSLSAALLLFG
jgi:predicted permease